MKEKKFKRFIEKLIDDDYRHRILLTASAILSTIIGIIAAIVNIYAKESFLTYLCWFLFSFSLIITVLAIIFPNRINLISSFYAILIIPVFLFSLTNGGSDGFTSVWVILIPIFAYSVYGIKKGCIISLVSLVFICIIFYVPIELGFVKYDYNHYFANRIMLLYLAVLGFTFFLETIRQSTYAKIKEYYSELKRVNQKLEKSLKYDPLTNIRSRYYFNNNINRKINKNKNANLMTLFMIDIDNFKDYNDKYGHIWGDYLLKELAATIKSTLDVGDSIYRWGGEEFVIISQNIDEELSREKAEKIRKAVEAKTFAYGKESCKGVTISIGFVNFMPKENTHIESITNYADEYMYMVKKNGKNGVWGKLIT